MTTWLKNLIFTEDERTRELIIWTATALAMAMAGALFIVLWLHKKGLM